MFHIRPNTEHTKRHAATRVAATLPLLFFPMIAMAGTHTAPPGTYEAGQVIRIPVDQDISVLHINHDNMLVKLEGNILSVVVPENTPTDRAIEIQWTSQPLAEGQVWTP